MSAIVLLVVAWVLIGAGVQGRVKELGETFVSDIQGPPNFAVWLGAVAIIAVLGMAKQTRKLGDYILLLVVLVFVLSNGGVFEKFKRQILE